MLRIALPVTALSVALLGAACTPMEEVTTEDLSAAHGAELFAENCAACHGDDATGGGPSAVDIPVPAPDLTQLSARNDGVFPRDHVLSVIDGYRRGAHFNAAMPVFGDGDLGPTVVVEDESGAGLPVPRDLVALWEYLETIQE